MGLANSLEMVLHDRRLGYNIAECVTHDSGVNNCLSGKLQFVLGVPLFEQRDIAHS